jgi:hypothetical protein
MASMNAAFWINPKGQVYNVRMTHIGDVISYPKKFGMSLADIKKIYDKHDEPLRKEGKAREEILLKLFQDGYVRIRKYKNTGYTVNVKKLAGKAKEHIYKWADKLLGSGIGGEKDYTTTPVLFDAEDKRLKPTTLGDIQNDISVMESKHEIEICHVSEWEDVKIVMKGFNEFFKSED